MIRVTALIFICICICGSAFADDVILNVSYDPTRELYKDFNLEFQKYWKEKNGKDVEIRQSHAGSGKQARAVVDGLEADVVTLALALDVDQISEAGLLNKDWQKKLANNSAPYTSTIVFLVRKGNPKKIKDWNDLIKDDVKVITPNPKTSGGARWNYLAAWGYAMRLAGATEKDAKDFVKKLFKHVPVLDTGARGSTNTFIQGGIGDVLVTWENEAFLAIKELGAGGYEIVTPSLSILAEPTVAVVDKVVDKRGTRQIAEAYLNFLYSEVGQDIAGKWYYRPRSEAAKKKYAAQFPNISLLTIDDPMFGGWTAVQAKHFNDGALFDQLYAEE